MKVREVFDILYFAVQKGIVDMVEIRNKVQESAMINLVYHHFLYDGGIKIVEINIGEVALLHINLIYINNYLLMNISIDQIMDIVDIVDQDKKQVYNNFEVKKQICLFGVVDDKDNELFLEIKEINYFVKINSIKMDF